ncbi:Sec-independent protein translocase subunit TatA [Streptomyces sp. GbtcB6]|uniref:Sec-independent protein translocase subunit TatA n=1 Tax=Streptomyces sp. GbtcB6 TaxID=2824751 RepID=UPI001C2F1AAF|nr:Sec-independent protein translocase subunit TatA [Streptomyces sp. GbtcB6]
MLRNGLEPWHLLIVAIVFIVLFGSRKLPDTARALGKSMRILKSEAKAMKTDDTAAPVEPTSVQMAAEPAAAPAQPEPRTVGEPTATTS